MKRLASRRLRQPAKRLASFTLIELLTVIAIIAILAALTLTAGTAVLNKAARSRAASEIQAMSTALEGYKTDNGIYPQSDGVLVSTAYAASDGTSTSYQTNSTLLYTALSGQSYYGATPVAGVKSYMTFKANQIGNPAGPFSYVKDPWNMSYGYSTATNGTTINPYNGAGFFDLWSTGGVTQAKESVNNLLTNAWISNWQ